MSGYLEGVLVLLAINVVYAYAAFLPVAAGQLNLVLQALPRLAATPRPISAPSSVCRR
jgi:branched-chain amino acid transport system permease protein